MNPNKAKLIESNFRLRIQPNAESFICSFYDNLFAQFPDVKALFNNTEMGMQGMKLLDALGFVVTNLCQSTKLSDYLKNLGKRHVGYGVTKDHYPMVGKTLLKTLREYVGKDWNIDLENAWIEAWNIISQRMLEGANEHEGL